MKRIFLISLIFIGVLNYSSYRNALVLQKSQNLLLVTDNEEKFIENFSPIFPAIVERKGEESFIAISFRNWNIGLFDTVVLRDKDNKYSMNLEIFSRFAPDDSSMVEIYIKNRGLGILEKILQSDEVELIFGIDYIEMEKINLSKSDIEILRNTIIEYKTGNRYSNI